MTTEELNQKNAAAIAAANALRLDAGDHYQLIPTSEKQIVGIQCTRLGAVVLEVMVPPEARTTVPAVVLVLMNRIAKLTHQFADISHRALHDGIQQTGGGFKDAFFAVGYLVGTLQHIHGNAFKAESPERFAELKTHCMSAFSTGLDCGHRYASNVKPGLEHFVEMDDPPSEYTVRAVAQALVDAMLHPDAPKS